MVAADPDLIIIAPCGLDLPTTRREMAALAEQAWWWVRRGAHIRVGRGAGVA